MEHMKIAPKRIAFVGAGNMASAIVGGLLANGYRSDQISAGDPSEGALQSMRALGVTQCYADSSVAVRDADLVVLAVKPQVLKAVAEQISPNISANAVVLSIAAGIPLQALASYFALDTAIVRCMPNTPALIGEGAAGLYAAASVSDEQRAKATYAAEAVGVTIWVENETLIDAVTALSGSGPAYFFAFMEAMVKKGEALGLSHECATKLTLQTAVGAAKLAAERTNPIDVLRHNVTSPGGTTEAALHRFGHQNELNHLVGEAMEAAFMRSIELAKEFS